MEWRSGLRSDGFLIELMRKSRVRTTWELNSDLNLSQVPLSSHLTSNELNDVCGRRNGGTQRNKRTLKP